MIRGHPVGRKNICVESRKRRKQRCNQEREKN